MSQNQEIIEAKLCAYIDGELDPEGIAEIEKHLEVNPQHRRLLESLKATRDLIRWLPRENAPPELAETLNGQLERSVLLDDGGDRSLRISPWPRILAAAAIVLLTAGLGAAVYFALPKHKAPVPYARVDDAKSKESHPPLLSTTEPEERREAAVPEAELMRKTGSVAKDGQESSDEDLNRLVKEVKENPDRVFASAASRISQRAAIANQSTTEPAEPEALVMLVSSADSGSTQDQLAEYFHSNQIAWKAVPEPQSTAQEIDRIQGAEGGSVQQNLSQLRSGDEREGPRQNVSVDRGTASKATGPAGLQSTTRSLAMAPAAGATTQNSITDKAEAQAKRSLAYNFPSGGGRIDGMYVARMSRRQAETLRLSQQAELLNDSEDAQSVAAQNSSTYERDAGRPNAIGRMRAPYGNAPGPTTAPTSDMATEPRRESVKFQEALERSNANAATQPVASGRRRDGFDVDGLAKQGELGAAPDRPTTQPAARPATVFSAATAPAVQQPDTPPADDEPVNVVIVVQQSQPTTGPTTAPATTEP